MADIEKRVDQFVKLRDVIKEKDEAHKEFMKPYRETLEQLNSALLADLQASNSLSTKTKAGTVYRSDKKSATVKDGKAFWDFVVANEAFDLIDKKANVTAVTDYIEEHKQPPPGINYSVRETVGVRRG